MSNLPVKDKSSFDKAHSTGDRKEFLEFMIKVLSDVVLKNVKHKTHLKKIFLEYISNKESFGWDELFHEWKLGKLVISELPGIVLSKLSSIAKNNKNEAIIINSFFKWNASLSELEKILKNLSEYETYYKRNIALVISEDKAERLFDYVWTVNEGFLQSLDKMFRERKLTPPSRKGGAYGPPPILGSYNPNPWAGHYPDIPKRKSSSQHKVKTQPVIEAPSPVAPEKSSQQVAITVKETRGRPQKRTKKERAKLANKIRKFKPKALKAIKDIENYLSSNSELIDDNAPRDQAIAILIDEVPAYHKLFSRLRTRALKKEYYDEIVSFIMCEKPHPEINEKVTSKAMQCSISEFRTLPKQFQNSKN